MAIDPVEKTKLRQFLINRFNLRELKELAFDLNIDHELLRHATIGEFSQELIAYLERRNKLSCLILELLKKRSDNDFGKLLEQLPPCKPLQKVQVIVHLDPESNIPENELREILARKHNVATNELIIIGITDGDHGNTRILMALPKEPLNDTTTENRTPSSSEQIPANLSESDLETNDSRYRFESIETFDSLNLSSQLAWRIAAREALPAQQGNTLRPTASWEEIFNRSNVLLLNDLLDLLYPEPITPDIITLTDFLLRYPLTKLGKPAVYALEQSQRIVRTSGAYNDIGLCEFHIGLIYLYLGHCRGATQQFEKARQQWSYVNKSASICLTHFAEGVAQHRIFALERAMEHYGKAERTIPRIHFEPSPNSRGQFIHELREALTDSQENARNELWRVEKPEPDSAIRAQSIETVKSQTTSTATPPPYMKTESANSEHSAFSSPVTGHNNHNANLVWYKVVERTDDFLSEIQRNTWLLIDTKIDQSTKLSDKLLVLANEQIDGSIRVSPQGSTHFGERIYLVYPDPILLATFTKDPITNQISFTFIATFSASEDPKRLSVDSRDILGYVVGLWLEIGESEILES